MTREGEHAALQMIGRLLEEAIGLADVHGETLVAVHIDQAIHALEGRMAQARGRASGLPRPGV